MILTSTQLSDSLTEIFKLNRKNPENTESNLNIWIEEALGVVMALENELQSANQQSTNKISQLERELKAVKLAKGWLRERLKSQNKRYVDMFNKHVGMLDRQLKSQDKLILRMSQQLEDLANCRFGIVYKNKIKSILTWE